MAAKLICIAGPVRGATYFLPEGETAFGRGPESQIQLPNEQLSKRHCLFVVNGMKVELQDAGSANGTFVNGVLVKKKVLENQDRVSIGPFVFELINSAPPALRQRRNQMANQMPMDPSGGLGGGIAQSVGGTEVQKEEPKSLVAKLRNRFDDAVVPVFIDYHTKYDWPTMAGGLFVLFLLLNLFFSVYPILEGSKEELLKETEKRAVFIAQQIASLNRSYIQEGKEALLNVEFAEEDPTVKEALIINLDGRIMAPASRLNQTYESRFVFERRKKMINDQKFWNSAKQRNEERGDVLVFNPILVLSKAKGINVPGAIVVVVMSTIGVALDSGTVSVVYFETLMISSIIGAIILYVLYHVTTRPLLRLHEDLEKVLRGESESIEKHFKGQIFDSLIDTINTAVARIPKSVPGADAGMGGGVAQVDQSTIDSILQTVQNTAQRVSHGTLMIDAERRVRYMNKKMEELCGFRLESSQNELVSAVSRDQSFAAFMQEVCDKSVAAGAEGITEDYEFQGALHKVNCTAVCAIPGKAEAFLVVAEKVEG